MGGIGAYRVAVSDQVAEEVKRFYRLRVHQIIANSVDPRKFTPITKSVARQHFGLDGNSNYALFTGGYQKFKGADLMNPACERAGWSSIFAGPGGNGSVNLGELSTDEMVYAYNAADVAVFPTLYEGSSLSLLEAISCGVPVLVTRTGSVPKIIEQFPQFELCLIEPNVDSIATALTNIADSPTDSQTLSHQTREILSEATGDTIHSCRNGES